MARKVEFPGDELPHPGQAIEWWYFNGFLQGNHSYAFMHCLFKADTTRVNLKFLRLPLKTIYFSHTLLFNLDTGEIKKEILPAVMLSEDSFTRPELSATYFYPLRKEFVPYEISRHKQEMRVRTGFFDLSLQSRKPPMLEGGNGYIDLGRKSTYYYSYTDMAAEGFVGSDRVSGKAWHDRQWSEQGFMKDSWLWFSFQFPDGTDIVCFDYKGKRMATVMHADGRQETLDADFEPAGTPGKSRKSGLEYVLDWVVRVGEYEIRTTPLLSDCEMNFGAINYWEGPVTARMGGKKGRGFMEYLASEPPSRITSLLKKGETSLLMKLDWNKKQ